jgi:hypothetical protein
MIISRMSPTHRGLAGLRTGGNRRARSCDEKGLPEGGPGGPGASAQLSQALPVAIGPVTPGDVAEQVGGRPHGGTAGGPPRGPSARQHPAQPQRAAGRPFRLHREGEHQQRDNDERAHALQPGA